jgi:hypothetical protein
MTRVGQVVAPLAAVLTMALTSLTAAAEPKSAPRAAKRAAPPKPKILRLEEMKVEGKIQKPQAMFLMPRANLNVGDLDRADPLLPKIAEAIEREPF